MRAVRFFGWLAAFAAAAVLLLVAADLTARWEEPSVDLPDYEGWWRD